MNHREHAIHKDLARGLSEQRDSAKLVAERDEMLRRLEIAQERAGVL